MTTVQASADGRWQPCSDKGRILADATTGTETGSYFGSSNRMGSLRGSPSAGAMEKVNGKLLPHGWMEETELNDDWFPQNPSAAEGRSSDTEYGLMQPMALEEGRASLI